jgi:hypothetical protein
MLASGDRTPYERPSGIGPEMEWQHGLGATAVAVPGRGSTPHVDATRNLNRGSAPQLDRGSTRRRAPDASATVPAAAAVKPSSRRGLAILAVLLAVVATAVVVVAVTRPSGGSTDVVAQAGGGSSIDATAGAGSASVTPVGSNATTHVDTAGGGGSAVVVATGSDSSAGSAALPVQSPKPDPSAKPRRDPTHPSKPKPVDPYADVHGKPATPAPVDPTPPVDPKPADPPPDKDGLHQVPDTPAGHHGVIIINTPPKKTLTVAADYDAKHFDPIAYLPKAVALARKLAPDAELTEISFDPVYPDGHVDLTQKFGDIIHHDYELRSPSQSVVPAGTPSNVHPDLPCRIDVEVEPGGVTAAILMTEHCDTKLVRSPRCSFAQVMQAAMSRQIGGGDAVVRISWLSDNAWFVDGHPYGGDGKVGTIPDGCR